MSKDEENKKMSTKGTTDTAGESGGKEDYTFRVQLLGQENVGKTSYLMALAGDGYPKNKPRKAPLTFEKVVSVDGKTAKVILYDMLNRQSGDVFRDLEHYQKLHGGILLADTTRTDSHTSILHFYWHIKTKNKGGIPMIALGSKYDLKEKRRYTKAQAKEECEAADLRYVEVSSKLGRNVDGSLKVLVRSMMKWATEHPITYETADPAKDPTQSYNGEEEDQLDAGEGGGCCIIS